MNIVTRIWFPLIGRQVILVDHSSAIKLLGTHCNPFTSVKDAVPAEGGVVLKEGRSDMALDQLHDLWQQVLTPRVSNVMKMLQIGQF